MEKIVKEFNEKYMSKLESHNRILDIQSEVGELAKEILKATDYGKEEFKVTDNMQLEFGDCLYSLITFGLENGLDSNKCLERVIDKYEKRFRNKGHIGSND